jgi:DNA-binding transcriptional MerR regulator
MDEISKKYYSISEVASLFGVNNSLIRFWETEFEMLNPQKNKNGERRYTEKDLDNLKLIFHLVKIQGYTLEGAKEKLRQNENLARQKIQAIESLEKVKNFLLLIKTNLEENNPN